MRTLALRTLIAGAAATLALAIAAGPASAGGYDRKCGDQVDAMGAPWVALKADNVSCRAARRAADAYTSASWEDGFKGWTCKDRVLGPEELRIKCKRSRNGGQRLKFLWGA